MNSSKIILILLVFLNSKRLTAQSYSISDNCLESAVFITVGPSSGSGFIYQDTVHTYFISAKHVLFEDSMHFFANECKIKYYSKKSHKSSPDSLILDLALLKFNKIKTYDDVVVIEIGDFIKGEKENGTLFSKYVKAFKNPSPLINTFNINQIIDYESAIIGNDVFMFGFPTSLGYNRPLLRKGVLAGKDVRNSTFIIDCPSYSGNSGGPVMMIKQNEIFILGIVSQAMLFVETWTNNQYREIQQVHKSNSGYTIIESFDKVLKLINKK